MTISNLIQFGNHLKEIRARKGRGIITVFLLGESTASYGDLAIYIYVSIHIYIGHSFVHFQFMRCGVVDILCGQGLFLSGVIV